MNSVQKSLSNIVQFGTISRQSLKGCSSKEISIIEQHFGCKLPQSYKDFLTIAGKSAGKLFQGTEIFFPNVLQLQLDAEELLDELGLVQLLPCDAKVFCMHQGYELNYFLPTSDDPPVFQYVEGQLAVNQPWGSFSEFLQASINDHLKQWSNLD